MKNKKILLLACALLGASAVSALAAPSGYHLLSTFTLGGEGGWDYLNLDPDSGNLFITRGSHVMVVNPASGKLVADIPDTPGVHGTVFVNGKAYISEGGANKLLVVDPVSFKKLDEIAVGTRPDGVLYDSASKHIFTFNGASKDATAVDPQTGKAIGTIALGGKPEAAASDGAGTIFVNVEDRNELVAFDSKTLTVKAHYPMAGCEGPSGMAADFAHGRIFSGCDGVVAVTDSKTGRAVARITIGDGVDANRFDPATGLIFSSNGESANLTIAHQDSADKYTILDNIPTANGARTMELDPKTHRVYVVSADRRPGTPTAEQPKPRPVTVPGTFRLLVLGR